MQPLLSLLALIGLTVFANGTPLASSCPNQTHFTAINGDVYRAECSIDRVGGEVAGIYVPSVKDCIEACSQRDGCVHVTYEGNTCYLKTLFSSKRPGVTGGLLVHKKGQAHKTSGADKARVTAINGDVYRLENSVDRFGGDLATVYVPAFTDCLEACSQHDTCVDVTYEGSVCYLKQMSSNKRPGVIGAALIHKKGQDKPTPHLKARDAKSADVSTITQTRTKGRKAIVEVVYIHKTTITTTGTAKNSTSTTPPKTTITPLGAAVIEEVIPGTTIISDGVTRSSTSHLTTTRTSTYQLEQVKVIVATGVVTTKTSTVHPTTFSTVGTAKGIKEKANLSKRDAEPKWIKPFPGDDPVSEIKLLRPGYNTTILRTVPSSQIDRPGTVYYKGGKYLEVPAAHSSTRTFTGSLPAVTGTVRAVPSSSNTTSSPTPTSSAPSTSTLSSTSTLTSTRTRPHLGTWLASHLHRSHRVKPTSTASAGKDKRDTGDNEEDMTDTTCSDGETTDTTCSESDTDDTDTDDTDTDDTDTDDTSSSESDTDTDDESESEEPVVIRGGNSTSRG